MTYNGGFVYEDGVLQYILNEEGRYNVNGANAGYEYNLKDHLGNVRMVINSVGEVKQSNNYYPFGGIFDQYSSTENKYQFGGKELQEGTDWLDFGARMYQAELGRWLCFDPMAELAHGWTPYRYCFNNPMNVTDPTGLYEWDFDRFTDKISYAGEDGGPLTQYVTDLFTGLEMIMDNSTFSTYFGLDPGKYSAKRLEGESWYVSHYASSNYGSNLGEFIDVVDYNSCNFTPFVSMDWSYAVDNYKKASFARFGFGDYAEALGNLFWLSYKSGMPTTPNNFLGSTTKTEFIDWSLTNWLGTTTHKTYVEDIKNGGLFNEQLIGGSVFTTKTIYQLNLGIVSVGANWENISMSINLGSRGIQFSLGSDGIGFGYSKNSNGKVEGTVINYVPSNNFYLLTAPALIGTPSKVVMP
jgi:RHS repeat-associated protein